MPRQQTKTLKHFEFLKVFKEYLKEMPKMYDSLLMDFEKAYSLFLNDCLFIGQ